MRSGKFGTQRSVSWLKQMACLSIRQDEIRNGVFFPTYCLAQRISIQQPSQVANKILEKAWTLANNSMAICRRPKRAILMEEHGWKRQCLWCFPVPTIIFP